MSGRSFWLRGRRSFSGFQEFIHNMPSGGEHKTILLTGRDGLHGRGCANQTAFYNAVTSQAGHFEPYRYSIYSHLTLSIGLA